MQEGTSEVQEKGKKSQTLVTLLVNSTLLEDTVMIKDAVS